MIYDDPDRIAKKMLLIFSKLIKQFFEMLSPQICFYCGKTLITETYEAENFYAERFHICRSCLASLPFRVPAEQLLPDMHENQTSFFTYCPFHYEGQMISILRKLKFNDGIFLAPAIGFFMGKLAEAYDLKPDLILPVPLSEKRYRERGYNQAFLLAREIGEVLNVPVVSDCLLRVKDTKRQADISEPINRKLNVEKAFCISDSWDIHRLSILLVDDILTTGATIFSASDILSENGALKVVGITAASGRTGEATGIINSPDASGAHVFEPS